MVDNKVEERAFLICLPWENRPRMPRGAPDHIKAQCAVCRGFICINPMTFKSKGLPADMLAMCGACALNLIDNDGGVDNHQFQLTDAQKEGKGSLLVRAAIASLGKDWPKEALEKLRAQRDYYDASKSAPTDNRN